MPSLVLLTLLAWAIFEFWLLLRDRASGTGSTARDRGTRRFLVLAWLAAVAIAVLTAAAGRGGRGGPVAAIGGWALPTGLIVMWAGVVIRVWAVVVLGSAFRTTVEVDAGQQVVDRGPYRFVRHPSYSGLLIIAAGTGLALGSWIALAALALLPLAALLRRIAVEEAALAEVLGQPYLSYAERTKRLVPGIW